LDEQSVRCIVREEISIIFSKIVRMHKKLPEGRDVPINKPVIRDPNSPATDPQKKLLKSLGYKGNTSLLTKQDASNKISELKEG